MNKDIKSRAELYGYIECREVIDIDRYAQRLMKLGDVFPPDEYGVYEQNTGICIVDFGRPGYYLSKGGRKHPINTIEDFDKASGNIFTHDGFLTLHARNIGRIQTTDQRPVFFKARDAAAALVASELSIDYEWAVIERNISDIADCLYIDAIEDSPRRREELFLIKHEINSDLSRRLADYKFHELWFHRSSNMYLVDVKMDIRIRDHYERQFEIRDKSEEFEHENGREFRGIRST